MSLITFFGSSPWILGVMLVMSVAQRRRSGWLMSCWAGWLAGLLVQVALRVLIGQWRPDAAGAPSSGTWWARYDHAGFTSGHAYRAAYLYRWLTLQGPGGSRGAWARGVGLAAIALVGISRVYLGRHWMSDVIGGWLVAAIAIGIARRMGRLDVSP